MSKLLLIPLEDTVVFPNMSLTLTIDTGDEDKVCLLYTSPSPRDRS